MIKPNGTVLILSRATAEWRAGTTVLRDERGCRVIHVKGRSEADGVLADVHVDIAIAEDGDDDGIGFLSGLRASSPEIIRVLAVGAKPTKSRNGAHDAGLYQVLRKPIDPQQLALVVHSGLELRELQRRQKLLARDLDRPGDCLEFQAGAERPLLAGNSRNFDRLVYVSEKMGALCEVAHEAALSDLPILIQGEAGSGKKLMARALHYHSARREGPFIMQNCSALTEADLQAELFGTGKSALVETAEAGALFSAANGGTLFLDDVSDISKAVQMALLGFLQKTDANMSGSGRAHGCDVRLLVASNRPLKALVASGKFRQELYFRLRGVELELPPLRERPDDIPVLAQYFAAWHSANLGRRILGISASALEKLACYDFPGNVRELESEIRRMTALARDGTYLTTAMMSPALLAAAASRSSAAAAGFTPQGQTLKEKIESLEKHLVRDALARHKWNRSRVAEELGLSRVGLANKIRRYGLNGPSDNNNS
jgi:two-component system response regulator HupR/HoxA